VDAARPDRDPLRWHLLLLLSVSVVYESLQLHHGLALFDEGWPAYAVMRLRAGGALYGDVYFPFPPGHLLAAWIAQVFDPPGIVLSRRIYSAFNTAACLGLYLLARRVMAPRFALLAGLLLAVAAPRSHWWHLLFGYRYMVFSQLALLCWARRLRSGERRFAVAAGAWTGVALGFSLTPAFAAACGVALSAVAAERDPRRWLRDWGAFALGLGLAVAPLLAWFAPGVGLAAVWDQVVMRVLVLQETQSRSMPGLALPEGWGDRKGLYRSFIGLEYRLYIALVLAYAGALAARWWRARRGGRAFGDALLLAIVVWAGASLLRTLGRTDESHLDSTLPPFCLLLAHALGLAARRLAPAARAPRRALAAAGLVGALAAWSFLLGTDHQLADARRGTHRLRSLPERIELADARLAANIDRLLAEIARTTRPEQTILDLSASPYLHVLSGRLGPGGLDVVMPGAFPDARDEEALLARLSAAPPAAVVWPRRAFDRMSERSLRATAPRVREWVMQRYRTLLAGSTYALLLPIGSPHLEAVAGGPEPEP
jgi:hypothetical protein